MRLHSSLGIVYEALGRREEAIQEGKAGMDLLPIGRESWRGLYLVKDLANIYVMVGESDAAINQLEYEAARNWGDHGTKMESC